jgi:hypothetical protein
MKPKTEINQDDILKKLNGRTLMIYFVFLNKTSIGVRELQRQLGLSSPSVAKYHIDKLVDLNLVENRNGTYFLVKKANIPALTSWILLGRHLVPRMLFIAIFFTTLFVGYLIFFYTYWNKDSLFVILFGITSVLLTWMEVILQLKNKPI